MRSLTSLLAFVLTCISGLIAARAQSAEAPPEPGPEVQKLAVLVGKFTIADELKAGFMGPNSPAMKFTGTDDCRWTAQGFAVICDAALYRPGSKTYSETSLYYYDPTSKTYRYHAVDSSGGVEDKTGTVNGDVWTWLGESIFGGKTYHTRYIMKVVSPDSYEYTDESGENENSMKVFVSGKETRVVAESAAADHPSLSPAQQEVINAHQARTEASNRRDQAAYSRFVADDCIFSTDDGDVVTKAQVMAHVGKLPAEYDHSINPRDYVVHVYGDTAVLNLRLTDHEQFTDSDIISEMRMTETYIKQDGRWLLIARQWGKIPVNFRKPVAVDTGVYQDYVGQYEWRPGDDVETISLKDGRLWTQSGKDVGEFLPLGNDTFFLKTELGTNRFIRDAQGRVNGYTYQDADGQEIHIKKIR